MASTQKVTLPPRSAYVQTPIYQLPDGTIVFGLLRFVTPQDPTDRIYTVPAQYENRLDMVSNLLYSSPDYWWAIAEANATVDPLMEVTTGAQLRIPAQSRLPSS